MLMRYTRSQNELKETQERIQVFKIFTYCESLSLHKLGSWSPQWAQGVKYSHGYRHPLARSRAVPDSVVPVGNTCFLYQALTWVFFLKCTYKHIQSIEGKVTNEILHQKQKQNPINIFNIVSRHLKDISPAQTFKFQNGLMYQIRSQIRITLAISHFSLQITTQPSRSRYASSSIAHSLTSCNYQLWPGQVCLPLCTQKTLYILHYSPYHLNYLYLFAPWTSSE